jgi:antitoxin component YwqK of YwqJK toxin-antitoxin module
MTEQINQHDPQGRPHGVWECRFSDGSLKWREYWYHGKLHGACEGYSSGGDLYEKAHYRYGRLHGLESYRSGVTSYCKRYHLNIK